MITSTLTEWYGEDTAPPTECPFLSSVGSCRRYSAPAVASKDIFQILRITILG